MSVGPITSAIVMRVLCVLLCCFSGGFKVMATHPIAGSAIAALPSFPPMPAVARILARFEREQLAGFIAVALDLLDTLDGDPEGYEGDTEDAFALSQQAVGCTTGPGDQASDTGEDDDTDTAVDDDPRGCDPESDFGGEEAGECEQMRHDVPTVPCYAIEPDMTGKRAFVGFWNPGGFVGNPGP